MSEEDGVQLIKSHPERIPKLSLKIIPQFASLSSGLAPSSYNNDDLETNLAASQTGIIGETVVVVSDDSDTGLTKVSLITSDRNGLMADIGSAFQSMGMSVQLAEMKSGTDGFVENTFVISGPDCGPIPVSSWDNLKSRLKASCSKRGRGRPWQERESRLRELFSRIDTMENGYIAQEDLDMFAHSLRMPRAFIHDFVEEGDQSGTGRMTFEEFAAFVRSKEISLQASFDSLEPDAKGRITGSRLKKNLKNMEIRAGRYNSRKKIRRKGVEKMLRHIDDEAVLTASDFRDMMILIPDGQLQTVSPYYMKVGLDMGMRSLPIPIPDKRKDGSPWGHLFAGGLAGIASKTVSSPLNVVAVRCIAESGMGGNGTSMKIGDVLRSIGQICKVEGVRGLFKGNMANSISSAPGKAIDFFAYAMYKSLLTQGSTDREPSNVERLLAGSLAGMTSDSILYPLEIASTRVSLEKGKLSFIQLMRQIVQKEGIRGLYAGWGAAMIGVIPYAGISFGCYDILSTQYRKQMNIESAGPLPTLCIGFVSGWLASILSFPLYSTTVKLQSGLMPVLANGCKANLISVMSDTIRAEGYRGLFKGCVPATLKTLPQAGVSFAVYEMVKRRLDKDNYDDDDKDIDYD